MQFAKDAKLPFQRLGSFLCAIQFSEDSENNLWIFLSTLKIKKKGKVERKISFVICQTIVFFSFPSIAGRT
jgi:hypothetical protein